VRQSKPLAENLRLAVHGKPLKDYHPQKQWLALISTGDQYAVASKGGLSFAGEWVWRWKDWIDRRFMAKFNELPAMEEDSDSDPPGAWPSITRKPSRPSRRWPCAVAAVGPRWAARSCPGR